MNCIIKGVILSVFVACIQAADSNMMRLQCATAHHTNGIVNLINKEAYKDAHRIVVLPERFRHAYVADGIAQKRFFVAIDAHDEIVGYKKLFCITDPQECESTLYDELRCADVPVAHAQLDIFAEVMTKLSPYDASELLRCPVTYIYNGADFTSSDHRGKGINNALTAVALHKITDDVVKQAQERSSRYLALAFGLTQDNAGQPEDVMGGRSAGIIKQFLPFASVVAQRIGYPIASHILLSRYNAFKPSFDPDAVECKPLPDDQSIAGYGCIIAYPLSPQDKL